MLVDALKEELVGTPYNACQDHGHDGSNHLARNSCKAAANRKKYTCALTKYCNSKPIGQKHIKTCVLSKSFVFTSTQGALSPQITQCAPKYVKAL